MAVQDDLDCEMLMNTQFAQPAKTFRKWSLQRNLENEICFNLRFSSLCFILKDFKDCHFLCLFYWAENNSFFHCFSAHFIIIGYFLDIDDNIKISLYFLFQRYINTCKRESLQNTTHTIKKYKDYKDQRRM